MAILTEFINFIVPIKVIKAKYPGGWEKCLEDHKRSLGGGVFHDDYLFCDGAMNPLDMKAIVEHWKQLGVEDTYEKDGITYWSDMCVFAGARATRKCEWLVVHRNDTVSHVDEQLRIDYYEDDGI